MSAPYPSSTHKRGTTFGRAGTFPIPPGTWTATAQLRKTDGTLVQVLACTMSALAELDSLGNTAAVAIAADANDTDAWPIETLLYDVKFVSTGGIELASETFAITVEKAITA